MKKIIVAPDSFKESISSKKACDIMAEALVSSVIKGEFNETAL